MVQNIYSDPAHNLECNFRFTCGASKCQTVVATSEKPKCHVDKFKRYQPENSNWYRKDWEDVNRITWVEVFSFHESWIYILYLIIITVFIFLSMILIKLLLVSKAVNLLP